MKNEFQYKLTNYQEAPPEHIWADIEAALNNQATPHAVLLYKFEQSPPPEVWDKVEANLEEKDEKEVSITKRIHFSRYAAAAAILILLASVITFITRDKDGNDIAKLPATEKETIIHNPSPFSDDTNNRQDNAAGITNNPTDNSYRSSDIKKERTASGRYLTIADDDGKKIRLSKKVASVFNCADDVASVKSIRCKENIESLQQKMSASLVSHSGDFSGLMDMIKSLEENK